MTDDAKHIMLDIETMSSQTNAAVLSVGMVLFSVEDGLTDQVEIRCEIDEMGRAGRHFEPSTIGWWLRQSKEAQSALQARPLHTNVRGFCDEIRSWIIERGHTSMQTCIWAKGPNFDIAVMRSLYAEQARSFPLHFSREYCVRTMLLLARQNGWTDILEMEPETKHGALSDAIHQANQVVEVMRRINRHGPKPSESAAVPSDQETDQQATT